MNIDIFQLERVQSVWENQVRFNLTESGIHPYTLQEILSKDEIEDLLVTRLGYGQTNGSIELRQRVSELYSDTDVDNILITNGSAEANFITVWNLLSPGDEMILMLPNYMQMWGIARSLGIDVKPFYLREESGWDIDLAEIENLISPKTRMIAVCNPNNPTGSVLSLQQMEGIIHLAERHGIWIYADEIYRGAELNGRETPSFIGMYPQAIVSGGLSKSYALPGLRIGWIAGPKDQIEKAWAAHDYTSITTGILSNRIASCILEPKKRARILERSRRMLNENLQLLQDWIAQNRKFLSFTPPKAGGMAFIRYDLDINSTQLSTQLRENQSVFIIAGDCFGMDHFIRIGIGSEKEYLQAGLDLIDKEFRSL
ncbi:aminotransferase class I/II-fold pyridoxal phosphate-dependent enzyme [Acidobacteriota bacterium]